VACILLIEDNPFIREALSGYLQLEEHQIVEFEGTKGVIETIKRNIADLVILDIMLPDGNGFSLAKTIREISDVPLMFLTAKDSESDRILGFEMGADDYVTKPFSTKELVLRVQALLKRYSYSRSELTGKNRWYCEEHKLEIDQKTHHLLIDGNEAYLTGAEWKILLYLAKQESIVVSRERILAECLNYFFEGSERTVDTHIANLRSKLGEGEWIETVRGYGYRFQGHRDREEG